MTEFRTVDGFAGRIRSYGLATQRASKAKVDSAALKAKRALEAELRSAIGPEQRMSNVGSAASKRSGGTKLSINYDVKGVNNPTALGRALGPWGLIENGSPAHEITPKVRRITGNARQRRQRALDLAFGARGAFSGTRPLRTPYGPRYRARVGPMAGKHPWQRGWKRAEPAARKELQGLLVDIVKEANRK